MGGIFKSDNLLEANTMPQLVHSSAASGDRKKRYHQGLYLSKKRDQKIALALSLWCLLIIGLLFAGMSLGAQAVQTEYNPGASYEPPEIVTGLIFIMWPLYVSVFLAVFMKHRVLQVLWVLLAGCLPVLLLLVLASLEYLPEALDTLYFVLLLFELLMMFASMVYLGNFWMGWFKGNSRGPSFKRISLQLCVLVIVLIITVVIYSQS